MWRWVSHTLIITGMATKTIHTCDICGDEAHTTRTIDVCTKHSVSGSTRAPSMTKCPECGKSVKAGAGLSIHMGRQHKPAAKKPAARKKAAAKGAAKSA